MTNTIEATASDTESNISLTITTCRSFDTLDGMCSNKSSHSQSSRTSVTKESVVSNNEIFVNENMKKVDIGVMLKNGALYCIFCHFWLKDETKKIFYLLCIHKTHERSEAY